MSRRRRRSIAGAGRGTDVTYFPAAFLSGAAAAGGIALINSIGNLAGFAGPYAMGSIKDMTGSYTGGLLSLSAVGLIFMRTPTSLGSCLKTGAHIMKVSSGVN